jgi:hypothetical protein
VRSAVLLICLAACRVGFDARTTGDGDIDAPDDGARPDIAFGNCWPAWRTGSVALSTPVPLAQLNSPLHEGDPSLSADALNLYFAQAGDLYVTSRADRYAAFGPATAVAELNSPGDETKLSMTADGLVAVWSTDRTGSQGYDLWESSRMSPTAAFAGATQTSFAQVNDNANQFDPHLSGDGLRLYLSPQIAMIQIVKVATRTSLVASFGPPVEVLDLGANRTVDPSLSPDELVMVYSAHASAAQPLNVWYATRASTADAFSNAQRLASINDGTIHDQDPVVSSDGCELLFARQTAVSADLFMSVVQ